LPLICTYRLTKPHPIKTEISEKSRNFGLKITQKTINRIFAATKKGNANPKNEGIQNLSGGM
jgi:transcriptional/translational regulatory protein YebC/TACO1